MKRNWTLPVFIGFSVVFLIACSVFLLGYRYWGLAVAFLAFVIGLHCIAVYHIERVIYANANKMRFSLKNLVISLVVIVLLIVGGIYYTIHLVETNGFYSNTIAEDHLVGEFQQSYTLKTLPKPIYQLLMEVTNAEKSFGFADIDQTYNATDVLYGKPPAPTLHLLKAGRVNDLVIVLYEQGGRGHSMHFWVIKLNANQIENTWRYIASRKRVVTIKEIQQAVKEQSPCLVSPPQQFISEDVTNCFLEKNP